MANALKGKTLTTIIMIFPDEKAVEEIEEQMRGVYGGKKLQKWPIKINPLFNFIRSRMEGECFVPGRENTGKNRQVDCDFNRDI